MCIPSELFHHKQTFRRKGRRNISSISRKRSHEVSPRHRLGQDLLWDSLHDTRTPKRPTHSYNRDQYLYPKVNYRRLFDFTTQKKKNRIQWLIIKVQMIVQRMKIIILLHPASSLGQSRREERSARR